MQPPQQPPQGPYPPQSPQSTPPYGYYPPQQPQPPQSTTAQKVTAWSSGAIALVIAGPIVAIILCCVLDAVFGVFGSIFGGDPSTTSTP